MRVIKILFCFFISANLYAQDTGFNPLKELQTAPNAPRITVSIDTFSIFKFNRRAAILVDGVMVADGDSNNPPTFEPAPGREFLLELCDFAGNGNLLRNSCIFGGVMRPTENNLYRFEFKFNQGVTYLVFIGKESF